MFELIQQIPEPWRQLADVLIAPLAWIPRLQHALWDFFFAPAPLWLVLLKALFLAFPALLAIAVVAEVGERTLPAFIVTAGDVIERMGTVGEMAGGQLVLHAGLAGQQPVHRGIEVVLIGVGHA